MTRHEVRDTELDTLLRRLLAVRDEDPVVLSAYLTLSLDPTEGIRAVTTRVHGLLADVEARVDEEPDRHRRKRLTTDLDAVRSVLVSQAPGWLGRGIAVFAAAEHALFAVQRLPEAVPDQARLGNRAHLRPLLAVRRRTVPYCAAVVDRRHAWLYLAGARGVRLATQLDAEFARGSSFAGWHGLDERRSREHATQLARHHYQNVAAALLGELNGGSYDRLVVGGHADGTAEVVATLPAPLRERLAGTFTIDPHTMTATLVRERADRVVADWVEERRHRLVTDLTAQPQVADGLTPCLTAAAQHAVELLAVPACLTLPGVACDACGALGRASGDCRVCGATTRAVHDVVDELVAQVMRDGGTVEPVPTGTEPVARLRHQVVGLR